MTWHGMSKHTGRSLTELDHIRQSVADILTTPVGSRVMRRDYGSDLFLLVDQPQHGATRLKLMAATVMALLRWEPRIVVTALDVTESEGRVLISISAQRVDTGESVSVEVPA